MGIFDVDPSALIKEMAKDFKSRLEKPQWSQWIKTGSHVERAPQNSEWWFERTASVLYRVYKDGPVGTESLRTYYGGRKHRGVRPEKKRKSSGKIIRVCLQALEKDGLIKKGKKGRVVTGRGESYLQRFSKIVKESPVEKAPVVQKEEKKESLAVREARETLKKQEQKEKRVQEKKVEKNE